MTGTATPKKYYTKKEFAALPEPVRQGIEIATLFRHLDTAGVSAAQVLRKKIEVGEINGRHYWNPNDSCGCVLGTLLIADKSATITRHAEYDYDITSDLIETIVEEQYRYDDIPLTTFNEHYDTTDDELAVEDGYDFAEMLVYNIQPGDTPETSPVAAKLLEWVDSWLKTQDSRTAPEPSGAGSSDS